MGEGSELASDVGEGSELASDVGEGSELASDVGEEDVPASPVSAPAEPPTAGGANSASIEGFPVFGGGGDLETRSPPISKQADNKTTGLKTPTQRCADFIKNPFT